MNDTSREERMTPYLWLLIFFLYVATFFEGYDFFALSVVLKSIGDEFASGEKTLFRIVAGVNCGAILAFFLIRLGDRVGRKPVFIASVLGYSTLSILTYFSPNISWYLAIQFFAKLFLVAEFGMAIIMVSEEMPPKHRGKYVALLEVAGGLGGGTAMIVSKYILPSAHGWRGMYPIGGAPILLILFMLKYMRETKHFQKIRSGEIEMKRESLAAIWKTDSRKWLIITGAMWFACYLCYAGVIYVWPYFAATERGWESSRIGPPVAMAAGIGMLGYVVSGWCMDRFGRRPTSILFFAIGGFGLVWAYNSGGAMVIPSLVFAMFFVFSYVPISSTINSELFPTERRAMGTAWCNYLLGRPAQIFAPLLIAEFAGSLGGVGKVVSFFIIGPLAAAFLVWRFLPETKGIHLDEIH